MAPGNEKSMDHESSDQVPRAMLLKRFPVPRNFGMAPESRIAQGRHGPAQQTCTSSRSATDARQEPE